MEIFMITKFNNKILPQNFWEKKQKYKIKNDPFFRYFHFIFFVVFFVFFLFFFVCSVKKPTRGRWLGFSVLINSPSHTAHQHAQHHSHTVLVYARTG